MNLLAILISSILAVSATEGDCGRPKTRVVYENPLDYEVACAALIQSQTLVKNEYNFKTDADIWIEFKDEVVFNFFDDKGNVTSSNIVYGQYNRVTNKVDMSSFNSPIVQNLDREHFSLQIKKMPLSDEAKDLLLKEVHQSVVVHELTHLFSQHNFRYAKPGGSVHEYLSYVVQIKSLSEQLRRQILQLNTEEFTHELQINSMIHYSAPHMFGVMCYRHFENLGDKKEAFLEDILSGRFNPDGVLEAMP